MADHKYAEGGPQRAENENGMATDALPDFQHLQKRISAIEMAVKQMNESFKTKYEMREIEGLKSGISRHHRNIQAINYVMEMDEAKEQHRGEPCGEQKAKKSV